jgi:4-coumarate--CoA ligase
MCGAAPLSFELNQQLFELFPDAHIGQAYGNYSYPSSGLYI